MSYVPLHDRPPYFANLPSPVHSHPNRPPTPGYARPDTDPTISWPQIDGIEGMSEEEYDPELSDEEEVAGLQGGPAKGMTAVARVVEGSGVPPDTPPSYVKHSHQPPVDGGHGPPLRRGAGSAQGDNTREDGEASSRKRRRLSQETPSNGHAPATTQHVPHNPHRIIPSFFNFAPRDPIIRTIGDFIMRAAEGKQNVEVEFKLGSLLNPPAPGRPSGRVRMPGLTEILIPEDYPIHKFESHMTKRQHAALNQLLNTTTEESARWRPDPSIPPQLQSKPWPIRYKRERQIDEFYQYEGQSRGGKIRVSRNKETGEVIEVIRKKRYADLNVANGGEPFDFRVSLSTEEQCEFPSEMKLQYARSKDRVSYKHQLCQVDLTCVEAQTWVEATAIAPGHHAKAITYELEVEVIDVPLLLKEGMKEAMGQPNVFDEMLTSILGTVRMLIRNAVG